MAEAVHSAHLLRALRHRNYRLFFGGQALSLIGTWMARVATSWLVYRLTGSAWWLGVMGFAWQIPTFLLSPLGGVLVDRWNKHRLLVVTQMLLMSLSVAMAVLAMSGRITVGQILMLSIAQGIINALEIPARQSFVIEMVEERADLPNAIALNSSIFNGARLVGPSIAGLLIASVGEGWCFLLDAASYVPVLAALLAMQLPSPKAAPPVQPVWRQLAEGLVYIYRFTPIRVILTSIALASLVGMSYTVLVPVFAREILGGGAQTFGFLMGASGLGAFAGAVTLASRRTVVGLGKVIALAAGCAGLALIGFACSRIFWVSWCLMLLIGYGFILQMASSNTVLQTLVEDDKRGRVMSFYAMAFMGMAPFGALLAGWLASRIGAPQTLMLGGTTCVIGAVAFARELPRLRRIVRPIYIRKGIIPEVAAGVQAAIQPSVAPKS